LHDEGHGFPEPARGNVFCPRPSDREGGAGIGLAISKQLADYLGAELELRRSTARGCVFALSLQLDAWEKAAEAAGVAGEDHWVAMNHLGGGWPRLE
jgi:nitrogen-specific signal transduction histidine kinase